MRDVQDAAVPQSIAFSAALHGSWRLRAWVVLAALVHAGGAVFVLAGGRNFAWPWLLAAAGIMASVLCAAVACRPFKVRQIDISKAGAVALTVQQKQPESSRAVRLLPGSLLWEQLLVLRLGSIDEGAAREFIVLVFPDSLSRESFRALAVALRAIAGRSGAVDAKKIL
jgi:toxin CptA